MTSRMRKPRETYVKHTLDAGAMQVDALEASNGVLGVCHRRVLEDTRKGSRAAASTQAARGDRKATITHPSPSLTSENKTMPPSRPKSLRSCHDVWGGTPRTMTGTPRPGRGPRAGLHESESRGRMGRQLMPFPSIGVSRRITTHGSKYGSRRRSAESRSRATWMVMLRRKWLEKRATQGRD